MEAKERYDERHKRDREDESEIDEEKNEDSENSASPTKKSRVITGPKDDLELEGADARPPASTTNFAIDTNCVGDMLLAFTFLVSYRCAHLALELGYV